MVAIYSVLVFSPNSPRNRHTRFESKTKNPIPTQYPRIPQFWNSLNPINSKLTELPQHPDSFPQETLLRTESDHVEQDARRGRGDDTSQVVGEGRQAG